LRAPKHCNTVAAVRSRHAFAMEPEDSPEQRSTELAHLERAFALVLESAPDAILVSDPEGRIVLANRMAERTFGYSREELLGSPIELLVPERYREAHATHRRLFWDAPRARYMGEGRELFARRKDGTEFPVEISLTPMHEGSLALTATAVRDITRRKQVQQSLEHHARELERSNAELEQFAYVASHDLQEPLRMVASYAQLLERRYGERLDEDAKEFIHYMVDGATRLQALINDLLAYSRVGSRGKPFAPTDLTAVVRRALDNLHGAIDDSGAVVQFERLPHVSGDASQLVQVFQNLIANAIKFRGDAPPRVEIGCRETPQEWVLSVRDHGIGIDPRYAERVFLLFQRLHTQREYPGTGIGLAICRKIIERHGGRIWVEPGDGGGANFLFTLPREERHGG